MAPGTGITIATAGPRRSAQLDAKPAQLDLPIDAAEKLDAGATLVQIYTGMIYRGPFFAKDLACALSARQDRDWVR